MSVLILIQTLWHSVVFLKELFAQKLIFKKSADDNKNIKNYPACKKLWINVTADNKMVLNLFLKIRVWYFEEIVPYSVFLKKTAESAPWNLNEYRNNIGPVKQKKLSIKLWLFSYPSV